LFAYRGGGYGGGYRRRHILLLNFHADVIPSGEILNSNELYLNYENLKKKLTIELQHWEKLNMSMDKLQSN